MPFYKQVRYKNSSMTQQQLKLQHKIGIKGIADGGTGYTEPTRKNKDFWIMKLEFSLC